MQVNLVSPVTTPRCHQISQHSEAPMAKPCWLSLPLPLLPPCPHPLPGPWSSSSLPAAGAASSCQGAARRPAPSGSGISCLPKSSSVQVWYFHGHKEEL